MFNMNYQEYEICEPNTKETEELDDKLLEEIRKIKPFTLNEAFVPINICAKKNGELAGGVLAYAVMWDILYIDTVWVREDCRNMGLAKYLLDDVNKRAVKLGCRISHLSTFDFQAPLFYKKLGYIKFGEIDYGHTKEQFYYKQLKS